MRLNQVALGSAAGIVCGVGLFLTTLAVMWLGGGEHLILLKKFYLGYSISFVGAILGLVYAFVDGFIGGWLVAFLYNRFSSTAE